MQWVREGRPHLFNRAGNWAMGDRTSRGNEEVQPRNRVDAPLRPSPSGTSVPCVPSSTETRQLAVRMAAKHFCLGHEAVGGAT